MAKEVIELTITIFSGQKMCGLYGILILTSIRIPRHARARSCEKKTATREVKSPVFHHIEEALEK